MTDTEKVALINKMIFDFWEFHDSAKRATGAETFVTAIYSVTDFEGVSIPLQGNADKK